MEADEHESDSAFESGGSFVSDTTSIKSEITRYRFEHGRRYHAYKSGSYLYPNDEQALEQMDIEHHNQRLQLGALHLSPLDAPQDILDVGTGTGIWTIEMADEYPSALVTGIDLSPTQPQWVPPNANFRVDDFNDEWVFGSNRFDLVHCRFLYGSVSDIPALLRRSFEALKPGGWHEQNEVETMVYCDDGTFPKDGASVLWAKELSAAFEKMNRPWPKGPQLKLLFEDVGFVNVQIMELKRPTNNWPKDKHMKEIGKFTYLNYLIGLEGFSLGPFIRVLGWTEDEVQVLMAQIRQEFANKRYHGYQKGWVVWGMKPRNKEKSP